MEEIVQVSRHTLSACSLHKNFFRSCEKKPYQSAFFSILLQMINHQFYRHNLQEKNNPFKIDISITNDYNNLLIYKKKCMHTDFDFGNGIELFFFSILFLLQNVIEKFGSKKKNKPDFVNKNKLQ
jgi:hypothetical protein